MRKEELEFALLLAVFLLGTLSVPINSHINWEENDYLTVLRHVEINPVYQRIIQDPDDPMNTLWYKFSDVAYTNQNSVLGSLVCMGSHYAGFLENGQCQVFYSASGTHNLKNEAMMFIWFFQGASTTGSSAHTPGYITYTTRGHYMTRLTVTTSGTASDVSYRFISILAGPFALTGGAPGVRVAILPGTPAIPPERGTFATDDPIRFGRSDMLSFSPEGGATPGTFYLASPYEQAAVRVNPATARTSFWLCRGGRWSER